jgi:amino-acid N-acetyltransferase
VSQPINLRPAQPPDRAFIESRLDECELPAEDLDAALDCLYVCEVGDERIGAGGLEQYDDVALLRSVVVDEAVRGERYGTAICTALLDRARDAGVEEVYLLTTTAEAFFAGLGFERTDREAAPEAIRETTQFSDLCPDSAACLRCRLDTLDTEEPVVE